MVILVVFDILVIFEISGTLNINGCSIIKKVNVLYFQSCKRNSNVFWLTCIIGFSGSISNYRSFSNCFNEGVCLVYNSNRNSILAQYIKQINKCIFSKSENILLVSAKKLFQFLEIMNYI